MPALKLANHLRDSFEFSFHKLTNPRLKENVLTALQPLPFNAWAIVVDKRNLSDPFRMMARTNFYNFVRVIEYADQKQPPS